MLDKKRQAMADQASAQMSEFFPSLWMQMFERCQEEGFSEIQSLELVKAYILSQCPWGIRP